MAEFDAQLLFEVLKRVQSDVGQVVARLDKIDTHLGKIGDRLERIEERVGQVERRITASTHLEQGLVGHLASLHESMDSFNAGMVAMDRRVAGLEAR